MNPCDDCPIDDKIYNCCGRYPETGETVCRDLPGKGDVYTCPHLDSSGACAIYERRPLGCRTFFCSEYAGPIGIGKGYRDFLDIVGALT